MLFILLAFSVLIGSLALSIEARLGVEVFILGAILAVMIAVVPFIYAREKSVNKNYYNENNDGIFSHYCNSTKVHIGFFKNEIYEIIINTNEKTVFLRANERSKTFSFTDIKEWESNLIKDTVHLDRSAGLDWLRGGFFITTSDFNNPIWQIKFLPEKGNTLEQQYKAWMNIFDRVINQR